MSTTLSPRADAPLDPAPAKPRRLRGLAWLMVRQHRAAVLACAAATVGGALWIISKRASTLSSLHAAGWPAKPLGSLDADVINRASQNITDVGGYLFFLPLLLGVFFGAPLIASDQEHGTAQLVTTQSVSKRRWLLWKLGFALALVTVTTAVLSALFTWWWRSAAPLATYSWLDDATFSTTGPVLVAAALFTTSLGILIGTLVRRAVPAMAVTLGVTAVTRLVVEHFRPDFATPHRAAFPLDTDPPAWLADVTQVDQWIGTASGKVYGYGTCTTAKSPEACRDRLGIVNSVWDYFTYGQLGGMQWVEAGIYLALTAVLITLFLWRTRRHAL
ncbi:ABC transporter permease [Actinomycetota bacterium Odt1-20B]